MLVGIVKVSSKHYVEKAIEKLGHTPYILQIHDPELMEKIKSSKIQKWIFTGSSLRLSVLNPMSPQVPLDILKMKDKEFFLICYSMESLFHQLGYPVVQRNHFVKETFSLGPLKVYRNHQYYVPVEKVDNKIKVTESYKGEVMTAFYKNTVLTQWHPERTKDGIECLRMWLAN